MSLSLVQTKQIQNFRQGRINTRKEIRRQQVLRTNLERRIYRQLLSEFSRFVNTKAYLFKEFNLYNQFIAARDLEEEFFDSNESHYDKIKKADEAIIFGRNIDIEELIEIYNKGRLLYLSGITMSIAKKVERIITDGREEGLSVSKIAENISSKVLPISRSRAALIARTETHNAASFANHQYHDILKKDLDLNMMKKWVSTSDDRTRSAHVEANGQVRAMNEDFDIGGSQMSHAGDPRGGAKNNVNCRCVIIYADAEDIVL